MSRPNGLHVNMSREEYDESPRANFSTLKLFAKSAAHFRHAQLSKGKGKDTKPKKFGRACHLAVYEPDDYARRVAVWEGDYRGKEWKAFEAKNADKEIIKEDEDQRARTIENVVRNHQVAGPLCRGGKFEVTIFWTYSVPAIGGLDGFSIDCKCRLDFISELGLTDLKTCEVASEVEFGKAAARYLYYVQGAFYSDAYFSVTGRSPPYRFIAAEKSEPFVVQVYRLTPPQHAFGREKYGGWLSRLNQCRLSSTYPGYSEGELELQLPRREMPDEGNSTDASGLGIDFTEDEADAEGEA